MGKYLQNIESGALTLTHIVIAVLVTFVLLVFIFIVRNPTATGRWYYKYTLGIKQAEDDYRDHRLEGEEADSASSLSK